jgi:hypothetical protein
VSLEQLSPGFCASANTISFDALNDPAPSVNAAGTSVAFTALMTGWMASIVFRKD